MKSRKIFTIGIFLAILAMVSVPELAMAGKAGKGGGGGQGSGMNMMRTKNAYQHQYQPQNQNRYQYRQETGLIANMKSWLVETVSGALGHGAVATYPDRPYLRWSFECLRTLCFYLSIMI